MRPNIALWLYLIGAPSLRITAIERQASSLWNAVNAPKHRALAVLHGSTEPQNYRDRAAYIICNTAMASIAPWLYFNGAPSLQIAVIERHASRLCNAAKHRALAVPHWSTDPPNDRDRAACIKPMDHPSIAPWLYCTGALSLRITAIERRISYSIT